MTIVAGAVQFPFVKFIVTMMLASPIRASIYAVLGGAVLELDLWLIAQITLGCVVVMILPFLHRKTRRLLLGMDAS
jgi:membrane protein DedA with SNARE-associated domain